MPDYTRGYGRTLNPIEAALQMAQLEDIVEADRLARMEAAPTQFLEGLRDRPVSTAAPLNPLQMGLTNLREGVESNPLLDLVGGGYARLLESASRGTPGMMDWLGLADVPVPGMKALPPIAAALGARATSRAAPALDALRQVKKSGQFVGAPPGVTSTEDVLRLRDEYVDRVLAAREAGVDREYFYGSGREALRAASPDEDFAARFGLSNAVTSSEAPVRSNVGWAIRAHEQEAMGAPITTGLYPNQMRPHLEHVLREADPDIGPKRQPYGVGLVDLPPPPKGTSYDAPNDRWEISSVFGPGKKSASEQQHEFLHNLRAMVAEELQNRTGEPWTAHQAQQLNWATVKARAEGKTYDQIVGEGGETIQGSLPHYMFSHTWESAPGGAAQHLPELTSADLPAYHTAVKGALIDPETGRDRLVGSLGGDIQLPSFDAPGVYKGDVAPGTVSRSGAYVASGKLDPISLARIDATEAVRAATLGQEAYAGNIVRPVKSGGDVVQFTGEFTPENAAQIESVISGAVPEAPWGGPGFALTGTPEGYQVMDIAGTRGFAPKLRKNVYEDLKNLGATEATLGKRVTDAGGESILYEELPWQGEGKSPVTTRMLGKIDNPLIPKLPELADSPEMRGVMGDLAKVYEAEAAAGRTPNVKIQTLVQTWASEGLEGVRRLVKQGLAPAAVLGVLGLGQLGQPDDRS